MKLALVTKIEQLLLLLLVYLATAAASTAVSDDKVEGLPAVSTAKTSRSLSAYQESPLVSPDNLLLVTLVDGKVVALDQTTGRKVWTFDMGTPLVSSRSEAGFSVLTGVDGGLYMYRGKTGDTDAVLERLPYSVPDLVEAAPSVTQEGTVILGKRQSTVFLIDAVTGRLLRAFSDVSADDLRDPAAVLLDTVEDPSRVLLLGRKDFIVRSLHMTTGQEGWNVSFSRMHLLTPGVFKANGAGGVGGSLGMYASMKEFMGGGSALAGPATSGAANTLMPRFAVGEDNSLQAFDQNGDQMWLEPFSAPPTSALNVLGMDHLDSAASAAVALPGSATAANTGLSLVSQYWPSSRASQPKIPAKVTDGHRGWVGSVLGHLYVLPAERVTPLFTPTTCDASDWPPGSPGGSNTPRHSTVPLVVPDCSVATGVVALPPSGQRASDELTELKCPQGWHTINESREMHPWLPQEPPQRPPPEPTGPRLVWQQPLLAVLVLLVMLLGRSVLVGILGSPGSSTGVSGGMAVAPAADAPALVPALGDAGADGSQDGYGGSAANDGAEDGGRGKGKGRKGRGGEHRHRKRPPPPVPAALRAAAAAAASMSSAESSSNSLLGAAADSASSSAPAPQSNALEGVAQDAGAPAPPTPPLGPFSQGPNDAPQPLPMPNGAPVFPPMPNGTPGFPPMPNGAPVFPPMPNGAPVFPPMPNGAPVFPPMPNGTLPHFPRAPNGALPQFPAMPGGASPFPPMFGGLPPELQQWLQPVPVPSRRHVDARDGATVVGKLRVGPGILGYGSAGTIVYEGWLDGRPVAVKRMLRQFYDIARKEIDVLIVSDEHPNVVRCFAMEEDEEFVYLALERCRMTLSDYLTCVEGRAAFNDAQGRATPRCLEVMGDICVGLAALHDRGIVHRDLKPHNVLLTETGRAKLSDMGLCKQLIAEQSSFESHGSGGSSGWQAPEQLIAKDGGAARQTRSMDVFSLGCVLYYCITGGRHPFGDNYERDANILRGQPNLAALQDCPEAVNLLGTMLAKDAEVRPSMRAVIGHPMWWNTERRLSFLMDISDRMEFEDREEDQTLLNSLESFRAAAVGHNWGSRMDVELVVNLGRYRRYDYGCLRDLLRVIRNKRNHFREMPQELQVLLGPIPEGFLAYFSSRFPRLLLATFFFALQHLPDEEQLAKYWPPREGTASLAAFTPAFTNLMAALAPAPPQGRPRTPPRPPPRSPSPLKARPAVVVASAAAAAEDSAPAGSSASPGPAPGADANGVGPESSGAARTGSSPALPTGVAVSLSAISLTAIAVGAGGTANGSEALGGTAGANGLVLVGYEPVEGEELSFKPFPDRPGAQVCDFFSKTGHCKFGDECRFDHPAEYAVPLTQLGLPYRPGQPLCSFYSKTLACKFGPACKFHHPMLRPVYAGSGLLAPPSPVEAPDDASISS